MRLAAPLLAVLALSGCFSAPRYEGPKGDHFDGRRFFNPGGARAGDWRALVRWQVTKQPGSWGLRREAEDAAGWAARPPARVGAGELRVTWIGHATMLLQLDGVNVLTDPMYSERASPVGCAGPLRHRPPGVRFEDLPSIDAVVISHNHYDHCDIPTLARLAREHRPRFLVPLGVDRLLVRDGVCAPDEVRALDWWEGSEPLAPGGPRAVCVPAQHFSNRGSNDRDATLWAGWVLESGAGSVYFAGDTGYGPHFGDIGARFGPVRLACLPIGAYRPRWIMAPVHISPEEALRAQKDLGAGTAVGMHYGTFQLGDDGEDDPAIEAARALRETAERGEPMPRFWLLANGEGRDVPRVR